jgi:hypothetical protein
MRRNKPSIGAWRRLAALVYCCLALAAQAQPVLRCFPVGPIYDYRWKLLALALEHTPGGADVRLEPYAGTITQKRSLDLLESGELDVVAFGTNPERETRALPVPVDILRGIVGYRVLLIRREDQAWFDRLDDDAMRRQCTFGLQRDWADLPIMRAAGFQVETAVQAENLFPMLMARRFDGFPRGLNEVEDEWARHRAAFPGLAVEAHRALYIPYPVYFWVRRGNTALAERIRAGLQAALADGSFRRLFLATYSGEVARIAPGRRHVLKLPNLGLPAGMPEPDPAWWWRPGPGAAKGGS